MGSLLGWLRLGWLEVPYIALTYLKIPLDNLVSRYFKLFKVIQATLASEALSEKNSSDRAAFDSSHGRRHLRTTLAGDTQPESRRNSGVHKGGFSKGGFSNNDIIITHKLLNPLY